MDKIIEDVINSGISLLDASVKYDVSVHKLRRYITSLKKSDKKEDNDLYFSYVKRNEIDKKAIFIDIVENDLMLEEVSKKYNCSLSTINKYISSLMNTEDDELKELYEKYLKASERHRVNGYSKGGQVGVRTTSFSENQIENIYRLIVDEGYTLRMVEELTGFKKSTIYDLLMKNLDDDRKKILSSEFRKHREFSSNDYSGDIENSYEFHCVGSEISKRRTRG